MQVISEEGVSFKVSLFLPRILSCDVILSVFLLFSFVLCVFFQGVELMMVVVRACRSVVVPGCSCFSDVRGLKLKLQPVIFKI